MRGCRVPRSMNLLGARTALHLTVNIARGRGAGVPLDTCVAGGSQALRGGMSRAQAPQVTNDC